MSKLILVAVAVMLSIVVLAMAEPLRLVPHEAAGAETPTAQQIYIRLQRDDYLTAKP